MNLKAFIFLLLIGPVFGVSASWASDLGQHPGYLDSVTEERFERIEEMVLIAPPKEKNSNLQGVIFDERLTREFRTKFEDEFGQTEAEQNIFSPSRFDEYEYNARTSVTFEEDQIRKQRYAEYMGRRLTEHHMDRLFRSNKKLRKVYELKERISKLNVEVNKGYKIHLNYSYSGNYMDIKLDNPYEIETSLRLQMEEGGIGPSEAREMILTLAKDLNSRYRMSYYMYSESGKMILVTSRGIAPGLGTYLSLRTSYKNSPDTSEGQNMVLIGVNWTQ